MSFPTPTPCCSIRLQPNEVRTRFDDGPDPKWTPKILDILKEKHVKGTFMMIGAEAQENIGLMQTRGSARAMKLETTHFSIPTSAKFQLDRLDIELQLTERLFASKLSVQPLYFRPPYDIDEEPETDDQAAPIVRIQQAWIHRRRQQD